MSEASPAKAESPRPQTTGRQQQHNYTAVEISERLERLAKPRERKAEAPPPVPAGKDDGSPKKKVTGCSERLAGNQRKEPKPLPPLVKHQHLDETALQKQIDSLYTAALAKKAREEEAKVEKYGGSTAKTVVRSAEEVTHRVELLAVASIENHKKAQEALRRKYLKESPRKVLDKAATQASVNRLYNGALQHQKEVNEKLERLYTPAKPTRKLKSDELKQSTERLASPRR